MNRRAFLRTIGGGAAALTLSGAHLSAQSTEVPSYLKEYASLYQNDPHAAALEWFRNAKFGLMMHYGLYSQLGRDAWVMQQEKIPVAKYEKLKDTFNPVNFDGDKITDLALAAGMKYITVTSKHHEGFCLFRTSQTTYNSFDSPARRDLIGELSEACHKKALGLFLYYSYALDWHHPYFCARRAGWTYFRPDYAEPQPQYLWRKDSDFSLYIHYVHNELRELLTHYGPLAGIWFDPIISYYARPDLFPITETYALISSLQPQCLISFKQGATGSEDFAAPERAKTRTLNLDSVLPDLRPMAADVAARAWQENKGKKIEICTTLEPAGWGYDKAADGKHIRADGVMKMIHDAWAGNANLLLNTGPLPDGSISAEDVKTLHEVGARLQHQNR